ncbi:MAG: phage holin family protein [Opitutales bacterium]|jgi:putative membrane protein
MTFLRNTIMLAAGVLLAAVLVPGIEFGERWDALFLVVLVLGVFNAVLKPLLVLFALPFIVLTLGVGLWIINALLLYWASSIVDGFHVAGPLSALAGAFVISLTHMLLSGMGKPEPEAPARRRGRMPKPNDDDVIDV